jgi:Na+-transporting NADH:ubiquinone oxidoreductase subunit NqrF
MTSSVWKFDSKNMLKNVVASVLKDLGFKCDVEEAIPLKTGEYIRGEYKRHIVADVLGRKLYALRYVKEKPQRYTLFYLKRPREGLRLEGFSEKTA